MAYTVHGPLAINFMDEPFRLPRHYEVLQASMEVAAELGAVHYVMHAGNMPMSQHDGMEAAYARQREWLHRAGELGRQHGMLVCVETLFVDDAARFHTATPSRLAREIKAVGHPFLRGTLDFSHSAINLTYSGGDLVQECAALTPLCNHLHIHDSFGRIDDIWMYTQGERVAYGHGDLHLPVGWGDLPWDAILRDCVFPARRDLQHRAQSPLLVRGGGVRRRHPRPRRQGAHRDMGLSRGRTSRACAGASHRPS